MLILFLSFFSVLKHLIEIIKWLYLYIKFVGGYII